MERIARNVKRELDRFGSSPGMADLISVWPEAVGAEVARNAWPARFGRDGTLHVSTSSAAWAFELGQLAQSVLEGLRTHLGDAAPRTVRFAVGPLPERSEPASFEAVSSPPDPTEAEILQAADLAAGIESEELRTAVAKAVARGLASGPADRSV